MIMFPCSHHACICSTVLSSWTSGLRCKGNWHKNKNMFQQTCISMNEMTTGCLSKTSAQTCNTCSLSVTMGHGEYIHLRETSENVNSCNIIKPDAATLRRFSHLRSRTCKSRRSVRGLLAKHVTFSSLSLRTSLPKKVSLISQEQCLQIKLFRLRYQASQNHQQWFRYCHHLSKTSGAKQISNHFR